MRRSSGYPRCHPSPPPICRRYCTDTCIYTIFEDDISLSPNEILARVAWMNRIGYSLPQKLSFATPKPNGFALQMYRIGLLIIYHLSSIPLLALVSMLSSQGSHGLINPGVWESYGKKQWISAWSPDLFGEVGRAGRWSFFGDFERRVAWRLKGPRTRLRWRWGSARRLIVLWSMEYRYFTLCFTGVSKS